jgi:peptidoglycan/xylan/chitin deacetylase (PgdA/CDA1 family)
MSWRGRGSRIGWVVAAALALGAAVAIGMVAAPGSITSRGRVASSDSAMAHREPATTIAQPASPAPQLQPFTHWTPPTTTTVVAPAARVPGPVSSGVAVVSRIVTNDPVVFFTVDDGFVRDPAVITLLRDQRVPVTLFVLPGPVRQAPDYFQAIHALGGSVQDHTTNHPNLVQLDPAAQQREICGPLDEDAARFGQRPWLFRPPYGNYNASTLSAVGACGLRTVVLWRATMNNGVLTTQGGPLQPGDIILMHFRTDLLSNLQAALSAASARGLHPAPLEAYLASG